jgi:hypothetical protein
MKSFSFSKAAALRAAVATFCFTAAAAERNLLVNPEFRDGQTGGWTDRTSTRQNVAVVKAEGLPEGGNAVRIEVIEDGGSNHGQLLQFVKVRPGAAYRVRAQVKADLPGMAYVQVKQMKGKSEGERLSTGTNKKAGDWELLEKEFVTAADTTAIQVLLRFRMNAGCVGKSAWFAQPSLVALDDGDEPPAPFEPPKAVQPVVAPAGADAYVTPAGAGRQDGSDWENAFAAADGGLQKAWDRAGPGNSVFVAGGAYGAATVKMTNGGASREKPKRLVGVDRGAAGFPRPVFQGNWTKEKPASGPTLVTMAPGASFIEIANLEARGYKGVLVAKGPNIGLRLTDVDAQECRDAFWLEGGATAALPDSGSRDIVLDGCDVIRYTKRALRTMDGVHDMKVLNCVADAGGKDYAAEVFPIGFHILGNYKSKAANVKDHHIDFVNCEARNNWHDGGADKYWNADGFAAERGTADLTFANCRAAGNTDGGWDLKTTRPRLLNCVAVANKRNYRVWTQPPGAEAVFENCLSAYATDHGRRGHDAGFWLQAGGRVVMRRCTAWEDSLSISVEGNEPERASVLVLERCLIAPAAGGRAFRLDGKVDVQDSGSVVRGADGTPAILLKAPVRDIKAPADAFDALSHPELGYKGGRGNAAESADWPR